MDLKVLIVFTIFFRIGLFEETTPVQPCPEVPSSGNATLADLTGRIYYLKYYKHHVIHKELDGFATEFKKENGSDHFSITVYAVGTEGKPLESTYNFTVTQGLMRENTLELFYSIPFLEEKSTAVLLLCQLNNNTRTKPVVQVLTTNLNNDCTKALKVAENITSYELVELPHKHRDKLLL